MRHPSKVGAFGSRQGRKGRAPDGLDELAAYVKHGRVSCRPVTRFTAQLQRVRRQSERDYLNRLRQRAAGFGLKMGFR